MSKTYIVNGELFHEILLKSVKQDADKKHLTALQRARLVENIIDLYKNQKMIEEVNF